MGESFERRMICLSTSAPLRSDDSFRQMVYTHHQIQNSPLSNTNILCIQDFTLDYMHFVCLGVMKRLLLFWKEETRICKLSNAQLNIVSTCLENYKGLLPSEMARQPRRLTELKRYKATEYRMFLLYIGMIALMSLQMNATSIF